LSALGGRDRSDRGPRTSCREGAFRVTVTVRAPYGKEPAPRRCSVHVQLVSKLSPVRDGGVHSSLGKCFGRSYLLGFHSLPTTRPGRPSRYSIACTTKRLTRNGTLATTNTAGFRTCRAKGRERARRTFVSPVSGRHQGLEIVTLPVKSTVPLLSTFDWLAAAGRSESDQT